MPICAVMAGGDGGFTPLQKKLRRFGPPQSSFALPVQAVLQSVSVALNPPLAMPLPQSMNSSHLN